MNSTANSNVNDDWPADDAELLALMRPSAPADLQRGVMARIERERRIAAYGSPWWFAAAAAVAVVWLNLSFSAAQLAAARANIALPTAPTADLTADLMALAPELSPHEARGMLYTLASGTHLAQVPSLAPERRQAAMD